MLACLKRLSPCVPAATGSNGATRTAGIRPIIFLTGPSRAAGKGGFNTPHDHPGWAWSGCYYVRVPDGRSERSGSIELLDSRTNLQVPTIKDALCFMSKFTIKPADGMLLLFPSWLRHWVYPNEDEIERVTIAFNARFVPR